MKKLGIMLIVMMVLVLGCGSNQQDPRIKVQEGVASDTLGSNIVTKPVLHAFSALVGDRINVTNAVRNDLFGAGQTNYSGFILKPNLNNQIRTVGYSTITPTLTINPGVSPGGGGGSSGGGCFIVTATH